MKERPVVHYVDLPVYGTPMSLAWKKHRMRCVNERCAKKTWMLGDHRIAAKNCLLTTRAAKWATVQVGTGRTVSEVASELACDWHTVNDAVITYGEARADLVEPARIVRPDPLDLRRHRTFEAVVVPLRSGGHMSTRRR